MSLDARVRQIAKELKRLAKELRSLSADESALTFPDRRPLGPAAARFGKQVAWVAQELRAVLDGPPYTDAPLVCYRVTVDRGTAFRWARTATVPVERWLAELANREVHRLVVQVQREDISHWLWELSQGLDAAPPLEDPDPRAGFRKAAELLLSPPPHRRPRDGASPLHPSRSS
ncbi:MAG TPA: hypothetical protein VLC07_06530 [Solirubrobacterales bacterium]|nr:hypothetical protein [Solirubrobacterales bacterium]